jgi:hypothetical protein
MHGYKIKVEENAAPEDVQALWRNLYEFNVAQTGQQGQFLSVFLWDELNNTQPSTLPSHLIIVALLLGFCGTAQAQEQRVLISTPEEIAENFVQVP